MTESGLYVYVSHKEGKQISVLRMAEETGELTKIQEVSVAGGAMPMVVSHDRRFLYTALRYTDPYAMSSFAIDGATGRLTHLADVPIAESSPYISLDRTGRFVLAAYNPRDRVRRAGLIGVSAISQQGYAQVPHQVIRTPPKAHAILADPSNRFVFATSCDGDMILRWAFDAATGYVDPDSVLQVHVLPKSGPRHFVFHPNNRFMYVLNEYDGGIITFSYDVRDGGLSEIQTTSALPPDFEGITYYGREGSALSADLHFTPDGKWLYASIRVALCVSIFSVDPVSGRLTPAGHLETAKRPAEEPPLEPGQQPQWWKLGVRGFNIDPFGRYLLATGLFLDGVISYKIDSATGQLTKVGEFATGVEPNWVEFARLP